MHIYFDNAATTKPHPDVIATYNEVCNLHYANSNSSHALGFASHERLRAKADDIAGLVGNGTRVMFTSGATEANSLAILGALYRMGLQKTQRHQRIITSPCEHSSVRRACRHLEELGHEVVYLSHDQNGAISIDELSKFLDEGSVRTSLVSLMHVNNETGVVTDVSQVKKLVRAKSDALLHVDGVAGFGKVRLNALPDLYTITAHKLHGLKGIGALVLGEGARLRSIGAFLDVPTLPGAMPIRPGTQDVAGAAAFAVAAKLAFANIQNRHVHQLRQYIAEESAQLGCEINGAGQVSPYIINISPYGVKAETLLNLLSDKGICVSAGSSCNSRQPERNILRHYGYSTERTQSSIRISFTWCNTMDEAKEFIEQLKAALEHLRKFGNKGKKKYI